MSVLFFAAEFSGTPLCPCGRCCTSAQSNTYQQLERQLCLRTGEGSSSKSGGKKKDSKFRLPSGKCSLHFVQYYCYSFVIGSVRTCRMELKKEHKPLIISIFDNYFRNITHINKTISNAPPSTQLFC